MANVSPSLPMSLAAPKPRFRTLAAVPVACLVALGIHLIVARTQPAAETNLYSRFLMTVLAGFAILGGLQAGLVFLRARMLHLCPIIAAAVLSLTAWEL